MKFDEISENELVAACKTGDDEAMAYVFEKYKNYVRKRAREFFVIGGDTDDLIQEGMIGLYKAIRDYDPEREAGFTTFACLCINRQIITAVNAFNCKKHLPLNLSISYDSVLVNSEGNEVNLVEAIASHNEANPEEMLIGRETVRDIIDGIEKKLSKFENSVFKMYMEGFTYVQIAETMDKPPKSIDNAIQRIKSKVLELLEGFKK